MLENRSFDHMLGFLYASNGNVSPTGQPFEGLTGPESNPDENGVAVPVMVMNPELQSLDQLVQYNLEPEVFSFADGLAPS